MTDTKAKTSSVRILEFLPPAAAVFSDNLARRELRWEPAFPLLVRLVGEAEEMIPGQLLNLSASGVLIFVDERFSLLLPPPVGTCFDVEFFIDELEIRQVAIEVRRVEKRGSYRGALGSTFLNLPAEARLALRGEIGARLATGRPNK